MYDVRGDRPRRHHGDAGAAGHVGIALGHVPGALLVAHEDVADRAVEERVVDREDASARQPEDGVDPLHLEGLDEDRKSVVSGKSVSVRVDLGGRRIIKKKNNDYSVSEIYL